MLLFQVPFDEDDKDKSVWFLDHDYLENMYGMFKKVNGKNIQHVVINIQHNQYITVSDILWWSVS